MHLICSGWDTAAAMLRGRPRILPMFLLSFKYFGLFLLWILSTPSPERVLPIAWAKTWHQHNCCKEFPSEPSFGSRNSPITAARDMVFRLTVFSTHALLWI